MKTKHILTAIALPALLAACSQDEDLSGALSQKDFSNIPTVDVNFTASIDGNSPTTRMATRFDWEEGDKVGLAWLGEGSKITIDGDAYQNHPLFCTDAVAKSFKTETMLYIGSYYAYMPYNAEITSVVPMEFDASNQELAATSASYAKKAIYISPKLTKLDDETAGIGKNTKLNLSRLSNAVTVNLTFGNAAKFEGLKVMGISVDAKTSAPASVLPKSFTYKPTKDADVKDWSDMASTAIVTGTSGNFFNTDGPATATVGAIKATSKEGLAVTNDILTTYILTLAATEAATKLDVVVSTNYGDVTVDLDSKGAGGADEAIVIKDKGTTEAKTIADAKIFNNFGASGSLDVYVDMSNLTIPSTVATQAELNEALKTLAITETETATTITVNPEKSNSTNTVDLTDFTFPEGLKCAVTLTAGDKATSGFAFKGNTVINSQLTLASAATVDGTMTINNLVDDQKKQKAALTMNASQVLTVNAGAKLINEGKIDISAASSGITTEAEDKGKAAAAEFVSNASTATVAAGSGTFTNGGKVQWIAGTLPTDLQGTVYANATTLNQLVGASEAFANNNVSATNEVTIDGALSIGNQFQTLGFENIKKLTIKEKVTLSMKAQYTVTNLAEINIEAGSLNFTDGDESSEKAFTPKAGCELTLSEGTELNVATGIKLDLGNASSIIYKDAIVTNYGKIVAASTSGSGTSSWIGNSAVAPAP